MNYFKLHRSYSISFNLSNAGEMFWGWIRKDHIEVLKKEKKNCVVSTYFIKRGSWYTCCFSYLNLLFFVCLFFSVGVWETEWLLLRSCSFWNCGLGVTVPPVVTSKPQFQNTFSATATLFPICYLSQLKHLDMKAIVLGKHLRRTSFIKPKPSTLCRWTNLTNNNHCVIFIFFSVYFS